MQSTACRKVWNWFVAVLVPLVAEGYPKNDERAEYVVPKALKAPRIDKITGVSMGAHQHPPYNHRPFEELSLGLGEVILNRTDIAIAVAGHDGMVAAEVPGSKHAYRLNDERLTARFFRKYDTIVYTDSIETMVHPTGFHAPMPVRLCCGEANKTLGKTIVGAQYKREHILRDFYLQFPDRKWFVLTEEDGWWSGSQLLALLSNVDRAVVKEAKVREKPVDELPAFVSGGPAGSIDGPFMLMNRALIRELAGEAGVEGRTKGLGPCRHALIQCNMDPQFAKENHICYWAARDHKFAKGSRDDGGKQGNAMYNWGHLMSFCVVHYRKTFNRGPPTREGKPGRYILAEDEANERVLSFIADDRMWNAHDSLPAFVQNGNRWVDAKPLAWSFFSEIAEIYKCCIHCKRTELHEYAKAEYALKHAMRNLVSWHHAKMPDIEWLDAVAAGNAEAIDRAVKAIQAGAQRNYNCRHHHRL
jgi:hypothetical protein